MSAISSRKNCLLEDIYHDGTRPGSKASRERPTSFGSIETLHVNGTLKYWVEDTQKHPVFEQYTPEAAPEGAVSLPPFFSEHSENKEDFSHSTLTSKKYGMNRIAGYTICSSVGTAIGISISSFFFPGVTAAIGISSLTGCGLGAVLWNSLSQQSK